MNLWLVAGLGNPGIKYEETKHNVGFLVLDELASRRGIKLRKLGFSSVYAKDGDVLYLKPQTFMNLSGQAVRDAARYHKIPAERILVVQDETALPPGRLRLRRGGSDGGHNGIGNILYCLGEDHFVRIKIGVGGKPHPDMDLADWVLSPFAPDLRPMMREAILRTADAVECVLNHGLERAMNTFNTDPAKAKEHKPKPADITESPNKE